MKIHKVDEKNFQIYNDTISYYRGIPTDSKIWKDDLKKIPDNTKIDKGFYKYNEKVFASIWKYKKLHHIIDNTNSSNFHDARELIRGRMVTEKIEVTTHSPFFPTVNGYIMDELDEYYKS